MYNRYIRGGDGQYRRVAVPDPQPPPRPEPPPEPNRYDPFRGGGPQYGYRPAPDGRPPGGPPPPPPPPPPEGAIPVQPTGSSAVPPTRAPQAAEPAKPRNPLYTFPYPLLVILAYLVLGFCFGLWHPSWVLFLTIPFYYWIASVIVHDPEYAARHSRTPGAHDAPAE